MRACGVGIPRRADRSRRTHTIGSNSAASHSSGQRSYRTSGTSAWHARSDFYVRVRIESRRAIGANDPKILQPVVIPDSVDVIENHRHRLASPHLAQTAKLTLRLLQASCEKAMLEMVTGVSRALDEDLSERLLPLFQVVLAGSGRIEVVGGYLPDPGIFLEDSPSATRRTKTERSQALSP